MEPKFLQDAIFKGRSANAIKLGTILTLGRFWVRISGTQLLYSGQGAGEINLKKIIAAADISEDSFSIPSGSPSSKFVYLVRRCNCCGAEEKTFSAATTVEFDSDGNIAQGRCNHVFIVAAKQIEENKISLKWFYNPVNQLKQVTDFEIYFDNATGDINYENPIGNLKYTGRKFYEFISNPLAADKYVFCIKAVAADGREDDFDGRITVQLNSQAPDGPGFIEEKIV